MSLKTKDEDKASDIMIYQGINIVEQNHRFKKRLTHPMMQFKALAFRLFSIVQRNRLCSAM